MTRRAPLRAVEIGMSGGPRDLVDLAEGDVSPTGMSSEIPDSLRSSVR